MIVAIGDVSGSQRRVRRQLGMSEGYLAGRAEPDTHPQASFWPPGASSAAASPLSVIGYGLAGDPCSSSPQHSSLMAPGMVPARDRKTGVRPAVKAT